MVPDTDVQLSVVIKALRDVVAPAVDTENRLAMEQLHLSIATLGLIQRALPLAHARARRELLNAISLAENVSAAGAPANFDIEMQAGQHALADPCTDEAALDATRKTLLAAIEMAVEASVGQASELPVARAVIAGSKSQFDLARAWCLPSGFELEPDALPSLEALLSE